MSSADLVDDLPKSIRIGGIDYAVEIVDELRDGDTRLYGYIDYGRCAIQIDKDLSHQRRVATLWHEVVHGMLENAGFDDHDERMVDALAHGLHQVMRDNPLLAKL